VLRANSAVCKSSPKEYSKDVTGHIKHALGLPEKNLRTGRKLKS